MRISDRTKMFGFGAVIAVSLSLTVFNVCIIRNAVAAPVATVEPIPQGRSVRAGDVGCSRFPKICQCNMKKEKGEKC